MKEMVKMIEVILGGWNLMAARVCMEARPDRLHPRLQKSKYAHSLV